MPPALPPTHTPPRLRSAMPGHCLSREQHGNRYPKPYRPAQHSHTQAPSAPTTDYSADGMDFRPDSVIANGPCAGGTWCSDSLYINKLSDGSYFAILKHGPPSGAPPGALVPFDIAAGNARWIFTSTSTDEGNSWSTAELALSPDWRDGAGFQVCHCVDLCVYVVEVVCVGIPDAREAACPAVCS